MNDPERGRDAALRSIPKSSKRKRGDFGGLPGGGGGGNRSSRKERATEKKMQKSVISESQSAKKYQS